MPKFQHLNHFIIAAIIFYIIKAIIASFTNQAVL